MKIFLWLCAWSFCFSYVNGQTASDIYVWDDVNVVSMDSAGIAAHKTVVVIGDQIVSIWESAKAEIPKNATIINGSGKFLMPGLADNHVHLPSAEERDFETQDFLWLQLAAGVTNLRVMRADTVQLKLRKQIESGTIEGPIMRLGIPLPSGEKSMEKLETFVRNSRSKGFDMIKYLGGLSAEAFDSVANICAENNMIFAGHAPIHGFEGVSNGWYRSVEHSGIFWKTLKKEPELIDLYLDNMVGLETSWCPTLSWEKLYFGQEPWDEMRKTLRLEYVNDTIQAQWKKYWENEWKPSMQNDSVSFESMMAKNANRMNAVLGLVKKFSDKGGNLLASNDAFAYNIPGFSLLRDLQMFKKAGLTNQQVLQTATSNAALFWGENGWWGVVKEGAQANLLFLDANPLENLENLRKINGVMANGKWYPKARLDTELTKIAAKARFKKK